MHCRHASEEAMAPPHPSPGGLKQNLEHWVENMGENKIQKPSTIQRLRYEILLNLSVSVHQKTPDPGLGAEAVTRRTAGGGRRSGPGPRAVGAKWCRPPPRLGPSGGGSPHPAGSSPSAGTFEPHPRGSYLQGHSGAGLRVPQVAPREGLAQDGVRGQRGVGRSHVSAVDVIRVGGGGGRGKGS